MQVELCFGLVPIFRILAISHYAVGVVCILKETLTLGRMLHPVTWLSSLGC